MKKNPVNLSRIKSGSPAKAILEKEPAITANFTVRQDANPVSRKKKLVRYQANPEPDWGPKARAAAGEELTLTERRKRGINKAKWRKNKRHQVCVFYVLKMSCLPM